jgi:hypothetical protein
MNISMNIDCTPEEARRLMGLPDMSPIHDLYMDQLKQSFGQGLSPELVEKMMRTWTPMGEVGFGVWKQLIDQMTGVAKK